MGKYTYSDSEAGNQSESFDNLSEIIAHIENFNPKEDSSGIVFQNGKELISYTSLNYALIWE